MDRVGCRVACTRLKSGSLLVGRGVTRPCRRSDISNVVVFFFSLYSYSGVPNCDLPIDAARRTDGKTDLTCLLCARVRFNVWCKNESPSVYVIPYLLVACYVTLHPALSVGWLVGWSVPFQLFLRFKAFWARSFFPKAILSH